MTRSSSLLVAVTTMRTRLYLSLESGWREAVPVLSARLAGPVTALACVIEKIR